MSNTLYRWWNLAFCLHKDGTWRGTQNESFRKWNRACLGKVTQSRASSVLFPRMLFRITFAIFHSILQGTALAVDGCLAAVSCLDLTYGVCCWLPHHSIKQSSEGQCVHFDLSYLVQRSILGYLSDLMKFTRVSPSAVAFYLMLGRDEFDHLWRAVASQ